MLKSSLCTTTVHLLRTCKFRPGINEMLSKRKPSLVNVPPNLMRILHPANRLTSCMTLVQRPQKFSTVLSAVKMCTLRNIFGLACCLPIK